MLPYKSIDRGSLFKSFDTGPLQDLIIDREGQISQGRPPSQGTCGARNQCSTGTIADLRLRPEMTEPGPGSPQRTAERFSIQALRHPDSDQQHLEEDPGRVCIERGLLRIGSGGARHFSLTGVSRRESNRREAGY